MGDLPGEEDVALSTNYETDEEIYRAVQARAQGYLLKNISLREMLEAMDAHSIR